MILKRSRGDILFRPNDECFGFVTVLNGTIRVSLTAESGREIVLYRVRPGEVCLQTFGCLIENRSYSAEGVAETDVELEIAPAADFRTRLGIDETFRDQLLAAVAVRFGDMERLVEDVALTGFEARLARALLRLMDADGIVSATHEDLAAEIGSGRAVVSRQLGQFAREGLIGLARGRIELLATEPLRGISRVHG